jgi:hypothetical protein
MKILGLIVFVVSFGFVAEGMAATETFKWDGSRFGNSSRPFPWCGNFYSPHCGKIAADDFCQSKGFAKATSFEKFLGVDAPGGICIGKDTDLCSIFDSITCLDDDVLIQQPVPRKHKKRSKKS